MLLYQLLVKTALPELNRLMTQADRRERNCPFTSGALKR
jgi:hypothetical protein